MSTEGQMSLVTYNGLARLVERGVVEGAEPGQINGASIDIRLGDNLLIEDSVRANYVDLHLRQGPRMARAELDHNGVWALRPGQFALANTMERFHLPDDVAFEYKLKSSLARGGLNHSLAGWADPGFHNATLTLELQNALQYHTLILRPGMFIGQLVFWHGEHVPEEKSYRRRGRYNNQTTATESKQ